MKRPRRMHGLVERKNGQLSLFDVEISVERAARLLNCSESTVRSRIEEGFIKAYRTLPGNRGPYKISYDSVVQYKAQIRKEYLTEAK